MSRSRLTIAMLSLVAFALVVAGCGGGSSSSNTTTTSEASENSASSGGEGTVSSGEVSGLGTVLVDSEGMTVYTFAKDKGSTSSCYGACEQGWPPVLAEGKPSAGEGAMSSQLGTTERKDGTMQVTYAGHPLYTFAGDTAPGEANGNESTAFGGKWLAVDEAGKAVMGAATGGSGETGGSEEAPAEETSEGSSGGYGY
ncbi:MAG: COG4315 family predicted lipoprotein [Solirubrobacterales bacterium]